LTERKRKSASLLKVTQVCAYKKSATE